MYDKLRAFIEQGEYKEALYELQEEHLFLDEKTPSEAAELCVLEASLWECLFDGTAELEAISKGLSFNNSSYELYYMLGLYYADINVNWAYLCMEMALFCCKDANDRAVISSSFDRIKAKIGLYVKNVSIMILSYNDLELLKMCISSIEETMPSGSFEVVVVDNASDEEGVLEYLREKEKSSPYVFKLIESDVNLGFPKGCNLGVEYCDENNDIFFLNNDAVLTDSALFWLRMALYDNRKVGAVGPLSNSASLQEIDRECFKEFLPEDLFNDDEDIEWHKKLGPAKALEVFKKYASGRSTVLSNPYISAFRLTGFALLISRRALNDVSFDGQVFDELFSPGYFEDDDLGIRLAVSGYDQYICKNSFIYHNGGGGYQGYRERMEASREKFKEKWGFDIWAYSLPWQEACDSIVELAENSKGILRIADFTCGFGANAAYIKSRVKNVYIAGVCQNAFEAGIARLVTDDVTFGEGNTVRTPWKDYSFDVVLADKNTVSKGQVHHLLKSDGIWFNDI